ncbi:MAG: S8 family serine peptidase, partial [Acidimicrobiia bacterium]|nr:S8 family serine peptidase [Acidimicrobiia bacterium]
MGRLASMGVLVLATPALLAAAPIGSDDGAPAGRTPAGATDTTGNGLSDDLEPMLDQMSPTDTVEVIVMADSPLARGRAAGRLGPLQIDRDLPIIDGFSATATAAQIRGLARVPGVERVQPNGQVTATIDAAQRDHGTTEARAQYGVDGTDIGVCVADTGVDTAHEQLDGAKLVAWHDEIGSLPSPYDDNGHGTHVSAIAVGDATGGVDAATYSGVAPAADLYAVKVLDLTGFGTDAQVVAGIDWCANQPGVDIISMSLGSPTGSDGLDAMSVAASNAVTVHGKVVVAASGNTGDA